MRYDFNETNDRIPIRVGDSYSLLHENPSTNHVQYSGTLYSRTSFTDDPCKPVIFKGSCIGNSSADRHSCSCRRQMIIPTKALRQTPCTKKKKQNVSNIEKKSTLNVFTSFHSQVFEL